VLVTIVSLLLASQVILVSVAVLPSQAMGLALTIIPPKLPADNGTYSAVVVSLVDSNGLPSAALSNLTVYLTSSQTNIASVPDNITIPVGSEYAVAKAKTTPTPGITAITASSHGLMSDYAQLTTATPSGFPSKFRIFVSPSSLLERADTGTVRVELIDAAGFPSKAITPVTALLSSSNVSIANLNQGSLTINPGNIYATGTFRSSGSYGQAVITASSTGYGSGGAIVTVVSPYHCTSACGPYELRLRLLPGTLPTDGRTYSVLEVGIANSLGLPTVSSSNTIVQLSSDKPGVVAIPDYVTIPAGNISVLTPLTTSSLQGVASITALTSSLVPGNVSVKTVIPAPSRLQAYVAPPSTFVSTYGNSPILVIQLQDSDGNPARARNVTDITVTSSNSSMVRGPIQMSAGVGVDYVLTHLTASGSGQSVLTASSQGLSSSQVDLQLTRSPLVDQLTASIPEETLYGADTMYTNGTATMTLSVSFLGQPVQNLNVSWTVTGGSVSPNPTKTGSSGATSTTFKPNKVGTANITASASSPLTGPIILTHFIAVFQAQTTTTTGGTTTATATTKTVTKSTTATTTVVSTETSYSTVTSSTTFTATVTSSTTIATTATSPTTTTVTTTTTSLSTSAASTFAYATLGATTIVILTVAALAAWVLRGRRP